MKKQSLIIISLLFLMLQSCGSSSISEETTMSEESKTDTTVVGVKSKKVKNLQDSILVDARDGKTYRVKLFDNLWWMIDNLNYDIGDNLYYKDVYVGMAAYCMDNKPENCDKLGRLYDLPAALKSCPKGWRLPKYTEWVKLNKKYANCKWDRASPTGNYRDSMPTFDIKAVGEINYFVDNGIGSGKFSHKPSKNRVTYWNINEGSSASTIEFDTEKCSLQIVNISSGHTLAKKLFYSCRCVKEAE